MINDTISPKMISSWVARRIDRFLLDNPHRTLTDFAGQVGVSTTTVSRWRAGEGNVATDHLQSLLPHLGATLDDMARELELGSVTPEQLPQIKARGARRKKSGSGSADRRPASDQSASGRGTGDAGNESMTRSASGRMPERIWSLSVSAAADNRPADFATVLDRAQQEWKDCFRETADFTGRAWRFGNSLCPPLVSSRPTKDQIDSLLDGLNATVRKDDLVLLHVCGAADREDGRLLIRTAAAEERVVLGELADRLNRFPCPCLLVLECLWPQDGQRFPGPDAETTRQELARLARRGLTMIAATLPAESGAIDDWPFIGRLWRDELADGQVAGRHKQSMTVGDLCRHAENVIHPRNMDALNRLAAGSSATVVPVPRMHYDADDADRIIASLQELPMQNAEPFDVDALAPAVHEFYRQLAAREGWTMQYDVDFAELPADIQQANREAALRIPQVLAAAGLSIAADDDGAGTSAEVQELIERNIERLAEAEHEGWMSEKLASGWKHGPERDDARKIHPCIRPYAELSEEEKEKDRNAVRKHPEVLRLAGLKAISSGGRG